MGSPSHQFRGIASYLPHTSHDQSSKQQPPSPLTRSPQMRSPKFTLRPSSTCITTTTTTTTTTFTYAPTSTPSPPPALTPTPIPSSTASPSTPTYNAAISPSSPIRNEQESLKGCRLLLVEDNRVNQRVAKRLLESLGCQVTIAENGQQALDVMKLQGSFDGILMDLNMPVMDGFDTAQAIRKRELSDSAISLTYHQPPAAPITTPIATTTLPPPPTPPTTPTTTTPPLPTTTPTTATTPTTTTTATTTPTSTPTSTPRTNKRMPIIALTASDTQEYRQRCLDSGMDNFLTKPLRRRELVAVFKTCILNP
eukprot:TRINITY_DN3868_c2_g1_i1.p1 TRINITY_DN3868_c2_g1~~TRINITY_DN3868_c2_g1_i1.p1  ORF type:complete len:310 (-),score=90.49 TRINITY_DN3868_c2_g1_i1:110-1039(-)